MRFRRDPVQTWWHTARVATGWEKVEAVGRLTAQRTLPADARAWLLRHGCDDVAMPEFVAHGIATAGRLEDALGGVVDDALLDGACVILSALVNGGPGEDIDDYEPGPRVAVAVLDLLADRSATVVRMRAVAHLLTWSEDYEQHVAIAERCGRLFARDESRRSVAARLEQPDDMLRMWGVATAMGLDAWDVGWRAGQSSDGLVAAALLSPVVSARSGALAALAAVSPEDRGPQAITALRRLAADEPAAELRGHVEKQLARLASG